MTTASILSRHSARNVVSGRILFMPRSEKLYKGHNSKFVGECATGESKNTPTKAYTQYGVRRIAVKITVSDAWGAYSGNINPASIRMYLS